MKKAPTRRGTAGKGLKQGKAEEPVPAPAPRRRRKKAPPRGTRKLPPSKKGAVLPRWWKPFMKELEENGGFKELAKHSIGISRKTPEAYLEDHPELRARYAEETEEAIERAKERILAEGVRRGVKGYEEPLVYQGELTGSAVTRFSDTLLIFSANAQGIGTREPAQVRLNLSLDEMREMPADLLQRLVAGDNPAEVVAAWRARQEAEKILGEPPERA